MKPNRTTIVLLGVIAVMGLLVLVLGALAAFLLFNKPLSPSMSIQTAAAPLKTVLAPAETKLSPTLSPTLAPTLTPAAEAKTKPQPVCGSTGTIDVLFTGADNTLGTWPFGADAVRVVRVDFDHSMITVIAFPRDLWVKTDGLADQDLPESPLGLAYYYRREATRGTDKVRTTAATTQVGQSLYDTFGLAPQSYITLQLDSFPGMIDILNGVEVNNPVAFTSEYGMKFPAGKMTLNGYQAREFIRSNTNGDAARLQRQNLFVRGVQKRILSLGILAQAPQLINELSEAFTTDLSPNQLLSLACMMNQVAPEKVQYFEVGGDLVTPGEGNILIPNIEKIKLKLAEWIG